MLFSLAWQPPLPSSQQKRMSGDMSRMRQHCSGVFAAGYLSVSAVNNTVVVVVVVASAAAAAAAAG